MKHKGKVLRRALALLYLALAALTAGLLAGYTQAETEELFLTPQFTNSRGWDIYTLEGGVRRSVTVEELSQSSGTVYLSRTLDPAFEESGYTDLRLDRWTWALCIYLDDALLYTTQPGEDLERAEPAAHSHGGDALRVSLPPGYGGRVLTIAARRLSEYPGTPLVILTSAGIETAQHVALTNRLGMPAAAYAAAFLLLLGLFLYTVTLGRADWPLLLLALCAATQSLYWLREFGIRFTANLPLDIPLAAFFPQLAVLLPLAFLTARMGRWKKWCALLAGLGGLAALAGPLLTQWYTPLLHGLYLSIGSALVFAALEARAGNAALRPFFPALGLLCGVIFLCCLLSLPGGGALAKYAVSVFSSALRQMPELLFGWSAVILFLLCALLGVAQTIRRAVELRAEVETLSVRDELTRENLRILQDSSAELAKSRHDFLHHLQVLQSLSREGAYGRLEDYLADMTREIGAVTPLKITGHPVVNAVLAQSAARAAAAGVTFSSHVELPDALPVPDPDLAAFLTNLLDNALSAAAQVPAGRRRWVEATLHVRGKYLFIEAQNSYAGAVERDEKTGLFRSRRGAGHGYGMKIMADVARRYQSELQAEAGDGVFLVRTALLMPQ